MKYVSIDIETTGVNSKKDEIIEVAAVIDDTDWFLQQNPSVPVDELPSFQTYIIKNSNRYTGNPFTLSMHKLIWERIHNRTEGYNYLYKNQIEEKFEEFLMDNGIKMNDDGEIWFTAAGKNFTGFDKIFLDRQIPYWKDSIKNNRRVIDPAAFYFEEDDDKLPDTETCMQRAGITAPLTHEALDDAKVVVQLIRNAWKSK